jgi:hypothetical protein
MYTILQTALAFIARAGRRASVAASVCRIPMRCSPNSSGRPGGATSSAEVVPAYRRPIVLAILLAMFSQLSGINAILYT